MISKQYLIQIYLVIISTSKINSYLLFAANIDDFRSIAKKIIPGQFADQLADMATKSSLNYRYDAKQSDSSDYESEDSKLLQQDDDKPKKRYMIKNQVRDIDLDELVKRVKEKLDMEYLARPQYVQEPTDDVTLPSIDDYYFKDETMNIGYDNEDYKESGQEAEYPNIPGEGEDIQDTVEIPQYDSQQKLERYADNAIPFAPTNVAHYNSDGQENEQEVKQSDQEHSTLQYGGETAPPSGEHYPINDNIREEYPVRQTYGDSPEYGQNSEEIEPYNQKNMNTQYYKEPVTKKETYVNNMEYEKDSNYNAAKVKLANNQEDNNDKIGEVKEVPVYYEDEAENETVKDDGEFLKEVDLLHVKDSYEDYVTPKRDDIFESDETTKAVVKKKLVTAEPKFVYQKAKVTDKPIANRTETTTQKATKTTKLAEIKAKTESLWYDDSIVEREESSTAGIAGSAVTKATKNVKGTMIPTRERFKMSSPNYLVKIKAVAEKYNFDEPLPEKDREPENLKPVSDPLASINKKVKLKF